MTTLLNTETTHELLKRNWFLDAEGIQSVLDIADHDAWDFVYKNRHLYAPAIRREIEPTDDDVKPKTTVREMTDAEWKTFQNADIVYRENDFKEKWSVHLKNLPPRPFQDCDKKLQDALEKYQAERAILDKLIQSSKNVYRAPGRTATKPNTNQEKAEKSVNDALFAVNLCQRVVDEMNNAYIIAKKKQFRFFWLTH